MKTLTVTEFATTTQNALRMTTCADRTFTIDHAGYRDLADLREHAHSRWHQNGDKVTNVEGGVRIEYAKPLVLSFDGWTRRETGRTLVLGEVTP